jgi:hypothetical protein
MPSEPKPPHEQWPSDTVLPSGSDDKLDEGERSRYPVLVPRSLGCEVAQNHGHGQYDESGEGDVSTHLRANA